MMKIEKEATLITAESKPYDFGGNSGTSHRLRFNIDNEIYVAKSTAEQVASLQRMVGQTGTAVLVFESRKENLSLMCESFS